MRFYRSERVSELIHRELGKIIQKELEFPGALVTITEVDVDKKLERAKVMVSVLPSEKAAKFFGVIAGAAPRLQHLLSRKINIKPMPMLIFEFDRGPENAAVVEKRLIEEENK